MAGEKTEQATPQRLKKAKREGQIGRSQEVGTWFGVLAASVMLPKTMTAAVQSAQELMTNVPQIVVDPDPVLAMHVMHQVVTAVMTAVLPLAATLMVVGIAAAGAQGGIRIATKLFMPNFKKLNPVPGIKRMVGTQALWELVKALVKTSVLSMVLWSTMKGIVPVLMNAGQLPLRSLLGVVQGAVLKLIRAAAVAGIVMAAGDYFVVRKKNNKQLKMSKEDIKQEYKNSEGDPHVKAQIRAKQMAMARNRQMTDLPQADVVLVNPVHVAVALRYEASKGAPRVVAKGQGPIAAKIREIAAEHRIPMVEDKPLARALYASCDVGTEIPPEFFGAVAKVLAFVMGLKARGSAAGLHRSPNTESTAAA